MPMDTTLVVALAEFWPTANTSRLPPWTRPLASARTPPATVAVGIITEMLIAPPLPPFDSAAALFFPVAETLTAPLDVTEPPLVISAVTSAALVTWASDEAPEPVNRPRESASALAVAVLVPVAVMATEPEATIVPLTEASTAPWTRAVGRDTPMPSPNDAAPASDWARATFGPVAVTVTAPETEIGPPDTAAVTSAFWPMSASEAAAAPDASADRLAAMVSDVAVFVWDASTVREAADGTDPPKSAFTPASTNAYETITVPATKAPPAPPFAEAVATLFWPVPCARRVIAPWLVREAALPTWAVVSASRGDDGLRVGAAGAGEEGDAKRPARSPSRRWRPEPPSTRRPTR